MSKNKMSMILVLAMLINLFAGISLANESEQTIPPQINTPEAPSFTDLPEFPGLVDVEDPTEDPTEAPTQAPTESPSESPDESPVSSTEPSTQAPENLPEDLKEAEQALDAAESSMNDLLETEDSTASEEKVEKLNEILLNAADAFKNATPEKVEQSVRSTVEKSLEIIKTMDVQASESVGDTVAKVLASAVKSVGTMKVERTANATVVVNKDDLLAKASAARQLNDDLHDLSQGLISKKVPTTINLTIENTNKGDGDDLELDLPELDEIFDVVDSVEVETAMGSIAISREMFGTNEKPNKIVIKQAPVESLPASLKNTRVISFEMHSASEKIKKFQKPVVVSIPFENSEQDDANTLTAFYLDDNGVSTPVPGYFENGVFVFKTNHFSKYYIGMNEVNFEDMDGNWAKDYVRNMASKGIINGKNEGLFDPEAHVTRAEFVTMIARTLNYGESEASVPFSDVHEKDWFFSSVQMLSDLEILKESEMLNPNETITREEMGVILGRTLIELGYNSGSGESLTRFDDMDEISDENRLLIATAVRNKLLEGYNGKFAPEDMMTRAQAATVIYRLISK